MDSENSLFFIGNATVLLRFGGFTILTDPNFVPAGEQVPVGLGMSVTRLVDPAIGIDQLPKLDAVVLSHYHGDHFDHLAEERLDRDVPIITTNEAAAKLADKGFRSTIGLDHWQAHNLTSSTSRLRITSLPARHA